MVSDVHGNLTAYEAVLADIEQRGITRVINLGDVVGKGPRGAECIALTQQRCEVTVRGNWDENLGVDQEVSPSKLWWRDRLSEDDRRWLRELPFHHDIVLSGRRVRMFHASAEGVFTRVRPQHTEDEFRGMFAATEATGDGPLPTVAVYGDVHQAYVSVRFGLTLVNVGSVGNALDEPQAAYVILEGVPGDDVTWPFGIQVVRLAYDLERELREAAALGNPLQEAYAMELRHAIFRKTAARQGLIAPLH